MRRLVQLMTTLWVLLLVFLIGVIQFNEYDDLSVIDCDTDGEVIFVFLCG